MKKLFFFLLLCSLFESQAQYTDVLPLNKNESRMLLSGILTYSITYPDSVQADLMKNLLDLQKFIDSKDTLSSYLKHIPVKVINFVELKYFGKDGIMGYTPELDNQQLKSQEQMFELEKKRLQQTIERLEVTADEIKTKISFQCKYYTANGYPCPADAPKIEEKQNPKDDN
jgi:hypothetical protein